jgi:putative inorganic carbon (hco3(-)) transporter
MTGSPAAAIPESFATGGRLHLPQYPPITKPMLMFFLVFVVARYIGINDRLTILSTIRFEMLLGLTAIIMATVKMSSQAPQIGAARPLLYSIIFLFILTAVQVPFAADPHLARIVFNDRVFKFAMLTFLMAVMVESPGTLNIFLLAYLFSIFYVTEESVEGLISGGLYWQNQGVMRLHGAIPMYAHPNSLGGVAMGSLPFVWFLFPHLKNWWIRLGLLATGATSFICVVYSGSRTAYLGLLALLLWCWFQSAKKVRFGIILASVSVVLLPLLPHQYLERFKSIGGHEAEGNSKETRVEILQDAVAIFKTHPFGVGVASFPAVRMARFNRSQDTHNLYLEVATNIGVQGLIAFLTFVALMLAGFRRVAKAFQRQQVVLRQAVAGKEIPGSLRGPLRKHFHELSYLRATAQAGAGFIVGRLVLGLFGMDYYEIYWWFAAGLVFVLSGLVVTTMRFTRSCVTAVQERDESAFKRG